MTIEEIINKWSINKALLASKMNMTKSTFGNKLAGKHGSSFTDKELFLLKTILIELREDLQIIDADFNEALQIIVS